MWRSVQVRRKPNDKIELIIYHFIRSERPTHDMADVLLSLKHAVLKPSPEPQQMQSQSQPYGLPHHPQASLSYTVHPQMLVSPSHQSQVQNSNYSSSSYYDSACGQHPPSIYPSMSVNVSMNMTMHGYGAEASVPMQCSQVQTTFRLILRQCTWFSLD